MLSALLLLLFANSASAFVGTLLQGSAASVRLHQHAPTFRTATAAVAATPRGGATRNFEKEQVCHDSRLGGVSENYGRDTASSRRAFLSKVAAFAGVTAGVLPAAVAGAGQVRSIGEVKKGIEADFRTRYVLFPLLPYLPLYRFPVQRSVHVYERDIVLHRPFGCSTFGDLLNTVCRNVCASGRSCWS